MFEKKFLTDRQIPVIMNRAYSIIEYIAYKRKMYGGFLEHENRERRQPQNGAEKAMDQHFMKEFYSHMYEDPVGEIMLKSEEFKELRREFSRWDSKMNALLKGDDREVYESLSDAANQLLSCVAEGVYLRGAEDRERMLR